MKPEFRILRVKQLERQLRPFFAASPVRRPIKGWIRALREIAGITLRDLAALTGKPHQGIASLEKSEIDFAITLKSLSEIAEAMDCKLIYAIVPKAGSVDAFVRERLKRLIAPTIRGVEHSMALEGQATGKVDQRIEEEAERLMKFGKKRKWKS